MRSIRGGLSVSACGIALLIIGIIINSHGTTTAGALAMLIGIGIAM